NFILSKNRSVVKLPISKIYYVTTHSFKPHTVVFVTLRGEFEANMSLTQIEDESAGKLKRCHRKYLVNQSKITGFDYATRTIMFMDSRIPDISCSRRYFPMLLAEWKNN
ncbi:TPA: LytTR family transcriptional regulator DNA-binding domain-containing protein, partial [Streptococcus suis]|nr:LytTR family transcriptional regulator DNA-binding domain-containing protein [Streptococcus suis]